MNGWDEAVIALQQESVRVGYFAQVKWTHVMPFGRTPWIIDSAQERGIKVNHGIGPSN